MIPSNQITMQDVPHKVLGIDDTGYMQLMHPEERYEYPGGKVFEIPVMGMNRVLALQLLQRLRDVQQ